MQVVNWTVQKVDVPKFLGFISFDLFEIIVFSRDGSKGGVWGGAHPPKIFQNAATRGSGGGGGRWWGVNCVIVTIECIVILGILIFYLSIQTLNHDIYFSDFDSQ